MQKLNSLCFTTGRSYHTIALLSSRKQVSLSSLQAFNYGIFDFFKKKEDDASEPKQAESKQSEPAQKSEEQVAQPETKQAPQKKKAEQKAPREARTPRVNYPASAQLKQEVHDMERDTEDNLFQKVKPTRKSVKERNSKIEDLLHPDLVANERVSIQKFEGRNYKRGLQEEEGEHPFPVVSRVGPFIINDPLYGAKNYFWCSCGLSKKAPFCDSSHVGTSFKPIKFSLDQPAKQMAICGCKLSKNAPFCDGTTCSQLAEGTFLPSDFEMHGQDEDDIEVEFEEVQQTAGDQQQKQQ